MLADPKVDARDPVSYRSSMTTMSAQIEAMINAEVERRLVSKRAELDERLLVLGARHQEVDRLIEKLAGAVSSSDTESVSSVPTPPPTPVYTSLTPLSGAPSHQLNFIFNGLRPRVGGMVWAMLRAAYNTEPARFELSEGHVSALDPVPHQTIFYKCPVHSPSGVTTLVIKIHVQYTEPTPGKRLYNRVLAQTLSGSTVPQEIANFV